MAQIILIMAIGNYFSWLLCPFDILLLLCVQVFCLFCVNTALLSDTTRFSRLIFYISLPYSSFSSCFKEPYFLLLGNGIRNQYLGLKCACCLWGVITLRPFQQTKKYMCESSPVYIYMSVYNHLSIKLNRS